ncbi:MAG TPA: hypothetical protein VMW18_14850 [Candidatus Binatia bacterium]|nr:hypothetical protein [Candidatus Binatia bacterium]
MRKTLFGFLAGALLAATAGPALAWSTSSAPDDPSVSSQFSDPDETVDNLANGSSGGGTDLSVQSNGDGSARILPAAPKPGDAEPVNPGWPAWMVWHQN